MTIHISTLSGSGFLFSLAGQGKVGQSAVQRSRAGAEVRGRGRAGIDWVACN